MKHTYTIKFENIIGEAEVTLFFRMDIDRDNFTIKFTSVIRCRCAFSLPLPRLLRLRLSYQRLPALFLLLAPALLLPLEHELCLLLLSQQLRPEARVVARVRPWHV